MNPFRSLPEYEHFVYTLQQRHPCVLHATLTVARRSRGLAIVAGELHFAHGTGWLWQRSSPGTKGRS